MIANFPAFGNDEFCTVKDLNVSILDLGLIHCDATYDVLAIRDGDFIDLDAHLTRFLNSCAGWRIPMQYAKEDIDHLGIEGVSRLLSEHVGSGIDAHCQVVRPRRREGIEILGHRKRARAEWDLRPGETVRVPAPVPPLVVTQNE